ncbi:YopX protein [Streptococcus agalactiae]|uniref:YopX family protein n=1 Tax=Streptococcus agalactiae TaxID=1311 RepID=UPI000E050B0B|nr:YopX family protein [Streptococcus agalactiae]SUN02898.1 YopX protein [Streptococcus agalactiae]HEO1985759.1 hypothetical protein [Streptococcus agalactiae]
MIPKFRAWLDPDMYEEPVIHNGKFYLDWRDFENGNTYDLAVLMQSTGMFDKNGVEIWEGDIVLTTRLIDYTYKNFKGVVKMLEGCWLIDTGTDAVYLWSEIEENEVIGNIYQNSELLERLEG